jgi:hypothetical protein
LGTGRQRRICGEDTAEQMRNLQETETWRKEPFKADKLGEQERRYFPYLRVSTVLTADSNKTFKNLPFTCECNTCGYHRKALQSRLINRHIPSKKIPSYDFFTFFTTQNHVVT